MLPAFMGIALFTRPRQLNDMEAPVRHADRLRQFKQADRPAVDYILRQQSAALRQTAAPALRGSVLMTAQGDMVGVESADLQSHSRSEALQRIGKSREIRRNIGQLFNLLPVRPGFARQLGSSIIKRLIYRVSGRGPTTTLPMRD